MGIFRKLSALSDPRDNTLGLRISIQDSVGATLRNSRIASRIVFLGGFFGNLSPMPATNLFSLLLPTPWDRINETRAAMEKTYWGFSREEAIYVYIYIYRDYIVIIFHVSL